MSGDDRAMVRAATAKWKPFAPVAEIAFDDPSEIFMAGFAEGANWAREQRAAAPEGER